MILPTQNQFPFGTTLVSTFGKLPTFLMFNDTETLVNITSKHIDELKEKMRNSEISVGKFDLDVFKSIDFSSNSTNAASPFCIWKHNEIKNEVKKLLQGKNITLKADITKGLNQNAVKFKEISIRFKMINENEQQEFDKVLENFSLSVTMIGNNYYRCGTKFYYISHDEIIIIESSLKKDSNGKLVSIYLHFFSQNFKIITNNFGSF